MLALERTFRHAQHYLSTLDSRPVGVKLSAALLRRRLGGPLPEIGNDAVTVIDELVANTEGGHIGSASARFFAWVTGGALPSALAADWLTAIWDQNAAMYASGPAAAVVEEIAGEWMKDLLDLPRTASFAFTTGCQQAHFTCLAAARATVLRNAGWNVTADGLFGAPPVNVLVSEHRHGSIDRALRFLGFGNRSLVPLATGPRGNIRPDALEAALNEHTGPKIVVLNAADLNIGAFDAAERLIPPAKQADAWVHVDGAFGLFARASRTKRALVAGVEMADSWATDAHKWLNVPFDCGMAFVKDVAAHRASMTISASYLPAGSDVRDQIDWTPEWSRRGRGFAVYAALRELGRSGVEDLVDRCCAHAHQLVTGIGKLRGAEILWKPTLNQGLVRFLDSRKGASAASHDVRTDATIAAINATGEAFFSGTTWRGKRAMRISVVNWHTTEADVERTIDAVRRALNC
jgi:aromatic-L-amino-acid decarboxylase